MAERLAARRRLERIRAAAGLAAGAAAGLLQAHLGALGLHAAAAWLAVSFYVTDRVARRYPEYSFLRGLASYIPAYLLSWFAFYAAFIR